MRVSVLLPVHNGEAHLGEALASLRGQTFGDFEVVLVDDGSNDAGVAVAREAGLGRRLRVLSPGRVGLIEALNIGLAACRGPFVARMDADDICAPDRLAMQAAYLEAHPKATLVGCRVRSFADGGLGEGFRRYDAWQNALLDHDAIMREMFIESPFAHPSVMFRRDAVRDLDGYRDCDWPEDYDLWLRLAQAGARFGKIDALLHHWRDHHTRESRTHGRYSADAFLRCKAAHLAAWGLGGKRQAVLWGAGKVGRRLGRYLGDYGVEVLAYVDIDAKKIGRRLGAAPVIAADELAQYSEHPLLAVVGSRGARELIRARVRQLGRREGHDFFCAA